MEKPYILIYDKKISNLKDFLPILEPAVQTGRPLLVIAEDVDSDCLLYTSSPCRWKSLQVSVRWYGLAIPALRIHIIMRKRKMAYRIIPDGGR